MRSVAKRFRAALARGGKRADEIAVAQTLLDSCATNELVKEPGVKTIAGANRINDLDLGRSSFKRFPSVARKNSFSAALDDQQRNFLCESFRSGYWILAACKAARLVFVGQENIDKFEHVKNVALPTAVGIIIGVE